MESVINELQLVISMYSSSQIHFDDPDLIEQLVHTPESLYSKPPSSIFLTIKLNPELELDIRIPVGYPESENLSASCRLKGAIVGRNQETTLNNDISKMIGESPCDLLGLINFCESKWDQLQEDIKGSNSNPESHGRNTHSSEGDVICRIWIHSHHIYNKHKRKFLIDTAAYLKLTGFSLPGKPGFVCVEGSSDDCDEYWLRVRQLTWQKISLIQKETSVTPVFLKPFEELRCDKSDFIKYLEGKNQDGIIKQYLGF